MVLFILVSTIMRKHRARNGDIPQNVEDVEADAEPPQAASEAASADMEWDPFESRRSPVCQ